MYLALNDSASSTVLSRASAAGTTVPAALFSALVACNQGRHSSQFATVVPTQIRFDPRDRVVGGRERTERMRGEGGAEHDIPGVDQGQLQVELDDDDELENEDLAGTP